jgi:FlaG/FlaF family flagellin (archaellin)
MKSFRRSIKAVSPVIATIIIVAIAITMSIAVAYWLLGLGGSFTKFEKVEFSTAYAVTESNGNFTLTLHLKNTGSATATIQADQILYNGKPASAYGTQYGPTFAPWCNATVIVMNPGQSNCTTISLLSTGATPWISGMTCEVTLHTTGGKDYPKALILP